jgi:hypothetical protein
MKPVKFAAVLVAAFWINQWFFQAGIFEFFALTTLPGTFLHECAHYLMAGVTDGHPGNFNLIPKGDTLGSVTFSPNWYNAAAVGWAPLLLMPLTAFFAAIAARARMIMLPIWTYVTACSWVASTPSPQDYSIAMGVPSSWPFGCVVLALPTIAVIFISKHMVFK